MFSFEGVSLLNYAPLAQLVEQLTLNQWVLGSSPRWCTIYSFLCLRASSGTRKAVKKYACGMFFRPWDWLATKVYRNINFAHQFGKGKVKTKCGPLVKRSRRRPLTPQTGVRFSHGSPKFSLDRIMPIWYYRKVLKRY